MHGLRIRDDGKSIDPRSLKRDGMGTGVWRACASAPKRSVPNLICGSLYAAG